VRSNEALDVFFGKLDLLEHGNDGRAGKARRIGLAVIDLVNNAQSELSAHGFAFPK
jgi:hypothetical protein